MHTKNLKLWTLMLAVLLVVTMTAGIVLPAYGTSEKTPEMKERTEEPEPGAELTGNNSAVYQKPHSRLPIADQFFNGQYISGHFNRKYVKDVDLDAFASPLTYARSNAAYTREEGRDLEEGPGHSNVIAGMHYYTLIYDVDPTSDYCVALPDVNLGNDALSPYAVDVVYNNNANETLEDVYFDRKTSILYIARKYFQRPKSEQPLFDKSSTVAIQTSYKMPAHTRDNGDPDYSKTVPVLVFNNDESSRGYDYRDVLVNNMLDVTTLLPPVVKDPARFTKDDFVITLNGTYAPLDDGQFSYDQDTGAIRIAESASVLSGITIMLKQKSVLGWVKSKGTNVLEDMYTYAADTILHDDMKSLKTASGKNIYIADEDGDIYDQMYLGWRGSYRSKDVSGSSMKYNVHTDELIDACGGQNSFMANSMKYLHAASSKSAGWAILSYAIGNDATKHATSAGSTGINKDTKLEIPEKDGKGDPLRKYGGVDGSRTLYDWMGYYRTHLLSYSSTRQENAAGEHYQRQFVNSDDKRNGAITFAFQFPEHIDGEPSLVDSDATLANKGAGIDSTRKVSLDIRTDEIDQDKTNLWLAGWCRHMDDGKTKDDGDTVYVSCIGKGTDGTGRYVVLAWSSAGAYSKYEQTGGAVYKLYVEDSCGKCELSKVTEVAHGKNGESTPEKGASFRVWNTRYASFNEAASHGSKYAQTLTQSGDKVISGDLIKGSYRIEQTSAGSDAGVARLMTPFTFQIEQGKTVHLSDNGSTGPIVNKRYRIRLELQKRSDDRVLKHFSNDTLRSDQITFEIASVDSREHGTAKGFSQTLTTDTEGTAVLEDIPAGYYRITETKPAPGYYLPKEKASITLQVGIDGTVRKTEEMGEDAYAITEIQDARPSSDPKKSYRITISRNNTPQNTVLSLTKHRTFKNEAGLVEQQPQKDVEFNLYARGNISAFDGHSDHVYYKDGTLIQGTKIDPNTGERTYYVDGKPTSEECYRIITDETGNWSSENTDWKVYPLTGKEAYYEMQEAFIWEHGDHVSFSEEEKNHLKELWTRNLGRSPSDKLNGAGELCFEQMLNHGLDITHLNVSEETGNSVQKYRLSSAGYLIDDPMLRNFLMERILRHIKKGENVIKSDVPVGTIARDVRVLSPSEAADISRVKDTFQVTPFDASSLTSEHVSAFVNDQVPTLQTDARSKNGNEIPEKGRVSITDTLNYSNLIPGATYTIKGALYDKGTGRLLEKEGAPYQVVRTFTPLRRTGKEKVTFTVDAAKVKGDLVAFEEMFLEGALMVSHTDSESAAQTVKKKIVSAPKPSQKNSNRSSKKGTAIYSPQTGDNGHFGIYLVILAVSSTLLLTMLLVYYIRNRHRPHPRGRGL